VTWVKKGLVFSPRGQYPWMKSHAALPVPLHLYGDMYRVYFASRDDRNRSHVCYVEIDITNPTEVLALSQEPVLRPGPLGCFDCDGVYASSIVRYGDQLYLYYIGWNAGKTEPMFYSSIGLAVSTDNGLTFTKTFKAPILARSEFDPCLVTSPCVLLDVGVWKMWYVSGYRWEEAEDGLRSYYHVKYAESTDGVKWERNGVVCLDLLPEERNLARTCVVHEGDTYEAWFSYRGGGGYQIGYAESKDGVGWKRLDHLVGIGRSEAGWDSAALAYPWVFTHAGRRYMLYNGNDVGREGFGIAIES